MIVSFTKKFFIAIAFVGLLFVSLFNTTKAQTVSTTNGQISNIDLSVSNKTPLPNQELTFTLSSYSINIDSATIRWSIDGVLKKEGVGIKTFNTQAGKSGEVITVKAEIATNDGRFFEQSITVNPGQVDLIIEADSYTPLLYKGRAYFSVQGKAKIIAIPDITQNGKKLETKDLNFKWKKDGVVLGSSSGTGKNTVIIEGSIPIRDIYITVEVLDSSKKLLATESIVIGPHKPTILFYEDSSLYGILSNKAVSNNYNIGNKEEIKIVAKPFFFDISGVNTNESKYKWSINGKSTTLSGPKNELILRQDGKTTNGTASVSLTIENQARIFQYATNSFNINFGN